VTGEDIFRDLPEIDIREIRIERSPVRVWQALVDDFGAQPAAAARYAQLVGADPQRPIGCFPEVGASVPGFAVAVARADERLVLVGRHRFSRYALVFDLEPSGEGTRLTATTYASFPGLLGGVYRCAVICSGGHRLIVKRMLRSIASRARY
jgi:hypothetical protein